MIGAVRPHRTSSNHCDEWGNRLNGSFEGVLGGSLSHRTTSNNGDEGGCRQTGKVHVRSERFEYNEPPRSTVKKREAGLQGRFE